MKQNQERKSNFTVGGDTKEGSVNYVEVVFTKHAHSSRMFIAELLHLSSVSLSAVLPPLTSFTACLTV